MRVLFTTFASSSHLNLIVPIAWAMRAAGNEVCVAGQPDIESTIQRAGLASIAVGDELDIAGYAGELARQGQPPGERAVFNIAEMRPEKLTWDYVRGVLSFYPTVVCDSLADDAMLDELVDFARKWQPDLVIWDALTYVGPVVARACDTAHARLLFGPDHFARMRTLFHDLQEHQPPERQDDPMAAWLTDKISRYGRDFDESMVTGQVTIDPLPSWLRLPADADYLPVRYVPYSGGARIPELSLEVPERPRVCLTLGLYAPSFGLPTPPIAELLKAVGELDVEVVATLTADQIDPDEPIPENVSVVDFIPLDALLPTCSAIVHHFGVGTLCTAMLHGVPQLRVSDGMNLWGEPKLAEQMVERGVALNVDADELTPDVLASRLARLVDDPSFRENALAVRKEVLDAPTPGELVGQLEDVAFARR